MEEAATQNESANDRVVGKPFKKGVSGNPKGYSIVDPAIRMLRREARKRAKEFLAEHEEELLAALPKIRPALIKRAQKGELGHIQEIHKVVGAHKKEGNVTAVQINFNDDRNDFA